MRATVTFLYVVLSLWAFETTVAFLIRPSPISQWPSFAKVESDPDSPTKVVNPLTKASWFAVEAFGKAFGSTKAPEETEITTEAPPASMSETFERIKMDNEKEYFLSGQVDKLIYDEQCTFADPFVSFDGRDRFVENLANLGSFITKYSARPLEYKVDENTVETKFMVKLELNLPWKPVLAWPWGVKCKVDPETNLIVLHEESWDIEAWEGVKQIFRKPTTVVN